jgi:two-component system, OmpR family, alkaline phosphatase synthesis response regulator PhoP
MREMQPVHRTVCVVEDDPAIRRGLVDSLSFAGYRVLECADGASARRVLLTAELDLVLLDVVLPGLDGLAFLPELRAARPTLPVLLVTARGAEEDRVRGLKSGADDYVVKPFSASELLARVEAVLRRSAERPLDVLALELPAGRVDLLRRTLSPNDGEVSALTERECELLAYLARNPGRIVSRTELLERVWRLDPRGLDTRTIDMTVARLREKLGERAEDARVVVTVRGGGYRLGDGVEVLRR